MPTRTAKGSWTMEELQRVIFEWPSDTPMLDPISEKVQNALTATIPFDLYPFALELISTKDGFISKKLALALIAFLVLDRQNWLVDADKVLSLRRVRVGKFVDLIKNTQTVLETQNLNDAAAIMARVGNNNFWHIEKSDFSLATTYLSQVSKVPIFGVLDALNILNRDGYDVAAALGSVIIWRKHLQPEFKPQQLELL